jgi:hypothetical protein
MIDLVHLWLVVGTVDHGTVSCWTCSSLTLRILSEVLTEEEDDAGASGSTRLTGMPSLSLIILCNFLDIHGINVPTSSQ